MCCLPSLQAKEMMEGHVRYDQKLLWKAARTGKIEVWKVVVQAVVAAGRLTVEQVSKVEADFGEKASAVLWHICYFVIFVYARSFASVHE